MNAGITVILVTHDQKVASFAHRTIRIADGLIESDGRSTRAAGCDSNHMAMATRTASSRRTARTVPTPTATVRIPMATAIANGNGQRRLTAMAVDGGTESDQLAAASPAGWNGRGPTYAQRELRLPQRLRLQWQPSRQR